MDAEETGTPSRIKFLCSFGGSILPRPQDGKLRYVGGETRIVCVPRGISYVDLLSRMQEIFEGATVLKYQQPDEDLDALVSVVNDDDVVNMMEEYDRHGAGDGVTRLRIFLFAQTDCVDVVSPHFGSDEREAERRYVDALNSLNDTMPEYRLLHPELVKIHAGEHSYNPLNEVEATVAAIHNQRSSDIALPPYNLHQIVVPQPLSGQFVHSPSTRYNEMEAPWNPAYYSPGHQNIPHCLHGWPVSEYSSSPSSGRYLMPFGDLHDNSMDRIAEEYGQRQSLVDNMAWVLPGANETGLPGNLIHSNDAFEGNCICEHCHVALQRNQGLSEVRYSHEQSHNGQSSAGSAFNQFTSPCTEYLSGHETYKLGPELKWEQCIYVKEQNEHPCFYNESTQERAWVQRSHQFNHHPEGTVANRAGEMVNAQPYVEDGVRNLNLSVSHHGHPLPLNAINHENSGHAHFITESMKEQLHEQTVRHGQNTHASPLGEPAIQYVNFPSQYGEHYEVPHGSTKLNTLWRTKVQHPIDGRAPHEAFCLLPQVNAMPNLGSVQQEVSPRFSCADVENQGTNTVHHLRHPQEVFSFDGSMAPEYPHGNIMKLNSNVLLHENQSNSVLEPGPPQTSSDEPEYLSEICEKSNLNALFHENQSLSSSKPAVLQSALEDIFVSSKTSNPVPSPSSCIDDKMGNLTLSGYHPSPGEIVFAADVNSLYNNQMFEDVFEKKTLDTVSELAKNVLSPEGYEEKTFDVNNLGSAQEGCEARMLGDADALKFGEELESQYKLPVSISSANKAAWECTEEEGTSTKKNDGFQISFGTDIKESSGHELESHNTNQGLEHDSDSDDLNISKIEPTKAEEEALARGLQTIKNDDLEEVRELGSGTYGAVYHGKWKGSDVAVKRIKATCFAGRPSERGRLIADFWKEALTLSSLHHPNVVSFYGIVRDGPDGSLATVTEFMVNGSLKQFLQKKDRTIDRRKRLIIAMDVAFGMEYLHSKNIVHFDLKCENLMVNMRDPHRPVCKIGDLGLSKVKQHTLVSGGVRGTLPWMAPELLNGKTNMVTEKVDVYSFGIVMWELLTGEEPYTEMHCASIIGGIVNNTLRPEIPTWCDPEWKSLMQGCWSSDASARPSFSEISQKLRTMAAAMNVK